MSGPMLLLTILAGGAGALTRYLIDFTLTQRLRTVLPFGTLVVNTLGAFALGLLMGVAAARSLPLEAIVVLGTGFLGAFTTFSTWMLEAVRLVERGRGGVAAVHIGGGLVIGVAACAIGIRLGTLA
jgi:CrcB protein